MVKRILIGAAAALLVVGGASAAEDRDCMREILRAPRLNVEALFARTAENAIVAGDGIQLPAIEVVLVRIGADGQPTFACVDTAEAAKRFLEAPIRNTAPGLKEK